MFIKDFQKTALILDQDEISYARLIEWIKRYSLLLKQSQGQRVAIYFENRPQWIYCFFAGWNAGAVNVLIDMMCSQDELEHILGDCQPQIVFTSNRNLAQLKCALKNKQLKSEIINVDQVQVPPLIEPLSEHQPSAEEIVLMLYTSGTTGRSKGVMLSYENIMKNIRWNNDSKRVNETDRMLAILPMHHSWPLISTVLCPLECGALIVFLTQLDAATLLATLKEKQITMVTAVPRLFVMIHDGIMEKIKKNPAARLLHGLCRLLYCIPLNRVLLGRKKVAYATLDIIPLTARLFERVHQELGGCIKIFISGGARLPLHVIRNFRAMGLLMVEGYGLTETAPMITYHPFDCLVPGSVGKVFDEIDIQWGEENEILVKGPNVSPGYWNNEAETRAAFTREGYFRTGDQGYLDKDQFLYLTGRIKDLIILSNGKNIRPDLIEQKIRADYALVKDIALCSQNNRLFTIIILDMTYVRREGIIHLNETVKFDVIDHYNRQVENYKKIQEFIITTADIPRTRLGKIQRYKLKDFIEQNKKKRNPEQAVIPDFEEYSIIAEHLSQIAGLKVLPDDHIEIDLGLDSLGMIEFYLFLEKSFGVVLKEGEISHYPTVNKLAHFVQKHKTRVERRAINWQQILNSEIKWSLPVKLWMLNLLNTYFRFFLKRKLNLKGTGMSQIPAGACIFAPNHASYLDSLFIYHLLSRTKKKQLYFYAKEKNFRNPFFRFFANRAHVIVMDINRDLKQSLQKIARVLKSNQKILIFPEGSRSRDGKMQAFKNTFATIAKTLDVPVMPVAIKGAFEAMPYTRRFPGRGHVSVDFLSPIYPGQLSEAEIVERTFQSVSYKLDEQ